MLGIHMRELEYLVRKGARTLEPHDFYRPFARLDNTHRGARRPTIGSRIPDSGLLEIQ